MRYSRFFTEYISDLFSNAFRMISDLLENPEIKSALAFILLFFLFYSTLLAITRNIKIFEGNQRIGVSILISLLATLGIFYQSVKNNYDIGALFWLFFWFAILLFFVRIALMILKLRKH